MQLEQELLHRFQNDLGYAARPSREFREIDQAGDRQLRALRTDRVDQLLRLMQWKPADAIDLLRNDHLARLQIPDHPLQLRPVDAGARRLLAVNAGHVVPGQSRALLDSSLTREVLLFRADAEVNASNFERSFSQNEYTSLGLL